MASGSKYLKPIAHAGAFLTAAAWGSSFLCTKVLMTDGGFTPVEMYVYRFAAAYLLLLLFSFKKLMSDNWKDELQFLLCGVCAGSLYFITENFALEHTSTGNVSLLGSMSPIFTAAIMGLVFRQRVGAGVVIGSVIAFAGVACIILSSGDSFEISPTGDLLALSASLSWAIYSIAVKPLIPRYSSLFITRKLFFYGVITALPLLFIQKEPYHLMTLFDFSQPQYLANFLFLTVFCSILAYIVWNSVMDVLGSVATSNYLYIQPLVTMIAAYFVLDEKIYTLGYIGCILIVGGLIFADKVKFKSKSLKSDKI